MVLESDSELTNSCFPEEPLGADEGVVAGALGGTFQSISKTYARPCLVITSGLFIKDMQNWYNFHQAEEITQ